MRIVAGTLRGRQIAAPRHEGLRPTSDRVREALFNILEHSIADFALTGARVIDLFAGTGALGLEALSRGAAFCLFVEDSAEARALIRANIETLELTGATRIFRRSATDLGPAGTMSPFNLALLDPPYDTGLGKEALASLASGGWLAPGAVAVLEERAGTDITWPAQFTEIDRRRYGDTAIMIARFQRA